MIQDILSQFTFKMWMAYVELPVAKDLYSAVNLLRYHFEMLAKDALYQQNRIVHDDYYLKLEGMYNLGQQLCEKFLSGQMDIYQLQLDLKSLGLRDYITYFKDFVNKDK